MPEFFKDQGYFQTYIPTLFWLFSLFYLLFFCINTKIQWCCVNIGQLFQLSMADVHIISKSCIWQLSVVMCFFLNISCMFWFRMCLSKHSLKQGKPHSFLQRCFPFNSLSKKTKVRLLIEGLGKALNLCPCLYCIVLTDICCLLVVVESTKQKK